MSSSPTEMSRNTALEKDNGKMSPKKSDGTWMKFLPLAVILLASAALIFFFDIGSYLSWEALSAHRADLTAFVEAQGALAVVIFIAIYALATALSLPGGVILTLLGGFLFGTVMGTVYVTLGATVGAVCIFMAARTALADILRAKVGNTLQRMEAGFKDNAISYMLFLRLIPAFPFWLVNIVPAFLGVSLKVYVLTTFFGILPGTLVYASLGNGLGAVFDSGGTPDLGIIFQPAVLLPLVGLAALSLVPILHKKIKARRVKA